jgi:hypothetical protein
MSVNVACAGTADDLDLDAKPNTLASLKLMMSLVFDCWEGVWEGVLVILATSRRRRELPTRRDLDCDLRPPNRLPNPLSAGEQGRMGRIGEL